MLTCIVICRSTDKKLYDNKPEEPETKEPINEAILRSAGGKTMDGLFNNPCGRNLVTDNIEHILGMARGTVDTDAVTSSIMPKTEISAFAAKQFGLGETLRPSAG